MSARSARRLLLVRRARVERLGGDRDRTELSCERVEVEPLAGAVPEQGCELEHAVRGPVGDEADEAAQVLLGFDAVQPGRRNDREERGGAFGVVIASAKEPRLASQSESPFILPMLVSRPWCTTDGIRGSTLRS